jgi:hypothetical protein
MTHLNNLFLNSPAHGGISNISIANGAGIFKQSQRARSFVGIGLSFRPARLHRLEELFFVESIPGPLKSLKIPALVLLRITELLKPVSQSLNLDG